MKRAAGGAGWLGPTAALPAASTRCKWRPHVGEDFPRRVQAGELGRKEAAGERSRPVIQARAAPLPALCARSGVIATAAGPYNPSLAPHPTRPDSRLHDAEPAGHLEHCTQPGAPRDGLSAGGDTRRPQPLPSPLPPLPRLLQCFTQRSGRRQAGCRVQCAAAPVDLAEAAKRAAGAVLGAAAAATLLLPAMPALAVSGGGGELR